MDDSKELYQQSQTRDKHDAREDELADYQLALQLNQQEMERGSGIIRDRQMSRSITLAIREDTEFIADAHNEERLAREDRRVSTFQ